MKKIIVGIGIPGSGKTTILKALAEKNGYAYICPDDIRSDIAGSASNFSKDKQVWDKAYEKICDLFKNDNTIVFDAAFTNPEIRADFLKFAREQGAEKIEGVYFNTPRELAKERNARRERKVSDHIIDEMAQHIEDFPPCTKDGFDSLILMND